MEKQDRYRRLVFLPDDSIVVDDSVASDAFDPPALAAAREVLAGGGGSFRAGVELSTGVVELQWIAGPGCVVSSVWCDTTIVLSALLLSGRDPAADAEVLAMYLASIRGARPVSELNPGNPRPFQRIETAHERPLYGAVLIPMVERRRCDEIVSWHSVCSAAFLWPDAT